MIIKELYLFSDGVSTYYFTSSDTEEVYLGNTYIPIALGRTKNQVKNELSKANIEVSFSIDNEFARGYLKLVEAILTLTVFSKVDAETPLVEFKGRLVSIKPEETKLKLVFETVFTSLRRPGLRRAYQRNCPHVLYGRGCNLDKDDFAVDAVATAVTTTGIVVPIAASEPDGVYSGGMVLAPGGFLRFITAHVGSNLTLIRPIQSLTDTILDEGSEEITIYPGCDRTRDVCVNRFDNLENNGSTPFIPIRNIFNGSSFT